MKSYKSHQHQHLNARVHQHTLVQVVHLLHQHTDRSIKFYAYTDPHHVVFGIMPHQTKMQIKCNRTT